MSGAATERNLWRHGDLARYWSACAAGAGGSGVSSAALPSIAVVSLDDTGTETRGCR
ncbi:hypothetical protein ACFY1P_04080 [Streptomyces sp. NPDC001407]|uniref:hypothetical protein n=1 Tax=Streptomyces sp. NPDC001407 TaxID=3364573 RepID=UPI00368E078E